MDAVERELAERRVDRLKLAVVHGNEGALRFYARRGLSAASHVLVGSVTASPGEDVDPHRLPPGLPVPEDDGVADHLPGASVPDVRLAVTRGEPVDLARAARDTLVLYVYPRTGGPGVVLPDDGTRSPAPEAAHRRLRLSRPRARARGRRRARLRAQRPAARRAARLRPARGDALPAAQRPQAPARRSSRAADLRGRRNAAVPTAHLHRPPGAGRARFLPRRVTPRRCSNGCMDRARRPRSNTSRTARSSQLVQILPRGRHR